MYRSNMLSYTVVKIALVSVVIFLLQMLTGNSYQQLFALNPLLIISRGFVWQFVTYLFLHVNPMHLLINMYLLVMFGMQVEEAMGSGRMWFYFFFCGIGAGLIIFGVALLQFLNGGVLSSTIGASGAVFGILIAFAFYYPDARILLFFIIPVKSKYLVFFYVAFEVYYFMSGTGGNISYSGHLGGIIFALVYFLIWGRSSKGFVSKIREGVHKKKTQIEISQKTEKEHNEKRIIVNKLASGLSLDDLSDDEYQVIKHFSVMHDDSVAPDMTLLKSGTISDIQFISIVRHITGKEEF